MQIYDSMTCTSKRSLSRFPDIAYSGSYRGSDGKVLVAGCEDSKIRVYDLSSRVVLRTLVGHTAPVKCVRFLSEQRFLLSGSDDNSVRTWDMTTEQNLDVLRGHTDYVRTVSEHTEFSAFCFLSAAYDHAIRYWDRRLSNRAGQACVFVLDHGAPVEDFLVLPNHGQGDLLATAGENQVQIWSLKMASSNPAQSQRARIHRASNHQKTAMSLAYDFQTDRMISGGLDHMVKIYDMRPSLTGNAPPAFDAEGVSAAPVSSFATEFMQVTHSMKFAGPILATAISPDSRVLVVGMADGSLSIRSRDTAGATPGGIIAPKNLAESLREDVAYQTPLPPARSGPKTGTRAYFGRGASFDPAKDAAAADGDDAGESDFRIARVRREKLAPYDLLLKGFKYHAALDAALSTNKASIIVSMMDELINRNALLLSLANRDASSLLPLLHFTAKYLAHPSYSSILLELVNVVLDLYAPLLGTVLEFDEIFYKISRQVLSAEIEVQKNCITVQAFMDNITSRSELKAWEREEETVEEENTTTTSIQGKDSPQLDHQQEASPEGEEEASEGSEEEPQQPKQQQAQQQKQKQAQKRKQPAPSSSSSSSSEEEEQESAEAEEDEDQVEADEEEEEEEQPQPSSKKKPNGHAKPAAATSSDDSSSEEEQAPPPKHKKPQQQPQQKHVANGKKKQKL